MSFKIYRYILFLILTIIFTVGMYEVVNSNKILLDTILLKISSQDSSGELSNQKTVVAQAIPVSIKDIISRRYLYTLTKDAEQKLTIIAGTGITLGSTYNDFEKVFVIDDTFIFKFNSWSIEIPVSKYYFDKLNKKPKLSLWEQESYTNWSGKKLIALTFDDWPSIRYTNILLDILKNENIKATFYVLGNHAEQYPKLIQREYAEWHEIWNHSYSHILFTKISERMMQEEIYKTDQAIYKAVGIYPKTFRPPYGWTNSGVLETIGMPAILWSIDPHDWKTHDRKKNIAAVSHARDGDILIMHDIHEESVASIPDIIKSLRSQWFTFVTVSELLSLSDEKSEIGKKCTKKWSCK